MQTIELVGDQRAKTTLWHVRWTMSALIGTLSVVVLLSGKYDRIWTTSAILWFTLSALGPAFVVFALDELTKLRAAVKDLSAESPSVSVDAGGVAATGSVVLLVTVMTTVSVGTLPFEDWAQAMAFTIACAFFLSYGSLIYIYGIAWILALRLGSVQVSKGVFDWPNECVRAIHNSYTRLLWAGVSSYIVGVAVLRSTPWARSLMDLAQPWILAWVGPPAVAALVFFVSFSVALHRILLQCQRYAEREMATQLELSYGAWKANSGTSAANNISELLKWREGIRQERSWPMDFKTVAVTIATVLIPSLDAVLKWTGAIPK